MRRLAVPVLLALVLAACGGGGDDDASDAGSTAESTAEASAGVRVVSPGDAAAIIADAPTDLVVLDVRTPQEFDEAHLDGAILVDFYEADFADRIAELDPDVPYVLYCRSGNRSSQARALMEDLGFTDVADVDGGILSWVEAEQPVVTG